MTNSSVPWQLGMLNKGIKKRQKLEALRKHLPDVKGKLCLLITCGDNNGAMNYRIREWGGKWIWAELEDTNVSEIEALLKEPVVKLNKSMCSLPFSNDYFDCVMTIDCHEHLEDPLPFNNELWRIIKSGGKVVVTVPNGNAKKLAVYIKHLVGMTKTEYGHIVIGYEIHEIRRMLKEAGFENFINSSYSKFFTEMIELCINFIYVKILHKNNDFRGEKTIAPVTQDQLQSVAKTYKLYSMIHPILWVISKLDALLFCVTGYAVVVEARKG